MLGEEQAAKVKAQVAKITTSGRDANILHRARRRPRVRGLLGVRGAARYRRRRPARVGAVRRVSRAAGVRARRAADVPRRPDADRGAPQAPARGAHARASRSSTSSRSAGGRCSRRCCGRRSRAPRAAARRAIAGSAAMSWCNDVVTEYERSILGRYPFNRDGQDFALADFGNFYKPKDGRVWAFVDKVLGSTVVLDGDHYTFSQKLGQDANTVYMRNADRLPRSLARHRGVVLSDRCRRTEHRVRGQGAAEPGRRDHPVLGRRQDGRAL